MIMLGLLAFACGLVAAVIAAGGAMVARHRAVASADLAAIAAARTAAGSSAGRAGDTPCEAAAGVVAGNAGRLVSCLLDAGGVATVYVRTDTKFGANVLHATARARAGPAETP